MSFIAAPFKADRGKRVVHEKSQYDSWDYLKDTRPEREKRVFPIGQSDEREAKFKVGFYRRPAARIAADRERLEREEEKQSFTANTAQARQERLSALSAPNGNILLPANSPAEHNESALFPKRRHFPNREETVQEQNHARQKVGASRFHLELNERERTHRDRVLTQRLHQQQQTTSVIGYGRADLATWGVSDNFKPDGAAYDKSSLISRPKLKPAPQEVQAAQRRGGGVQLTDGSAGLAGSGGFGTRGSASGATASIAPLPGRRANRSNQTSSALAQVFQYENVASWQQQQQQRRPVNASPAGSNAAVPP